MSRVKVGGLPSRPQVIIGQAKAHPTQLLEWRLVVNQLLYCREESLHGLRALVGVPAIAHRHLAVFRLAIAHYQHVGHLLQLRFANLEIHLLAAIVHVHAQSGILELASTFWAYSTCRSVIGSTTACTGASHTGNAPA